MGMETISGGNTPHQDEPKGEIEVNMDCLEHRMAEIKDEIASLEIVLLPVSSSESTVCDGQPDPVEECLSPLGREIERLCRELRTLITRLHIARENIQL